MRAQTFKWLFLKTLKSADSPFWRSPVELSDYICQSLKQPFDNTCVRDVHFVYSGFLHRFIQYTLNGTWSEIDWMESVMQKYRDKRITNCKNM